MKLILTDIDGVLTDGRVLLDTNGRETKTICYRDLDAIGIGRKVGYEFAFITGEDTDMARQIARRFGIKMLFTGTKDKLDVINAISEEYSIPLNQMLYIGESDSDALALEAVGFGIAPSDATQYAKNSANMLTQCNGGFGVLLEVVNKLVAGELRFWRS